MAGVEPMHKSTAVAAPLLRTNNAATEVYRAASATVPFFRLPRELRDEIYDLVALSEDTTYYDIILTSDEQSRKIAYVGRGADCAFSHSQFELEYAAAVQRRVKALMIGEDRSGAQLMGPGCSSQTIPEQEEEKSVWLELSKAETADGQINQNIHAFTRVINLENVHLMPENHPNFSSDVAKRVRTRLDATVVISFKFPEKKELGPRQRVDVLWDVTTLPQCFKFPTGSGPLMQQLLCIAKDVSWRGSLGEHMLWLRYVLRYVRLSIQGFERTLRHEATSGRRTRA
jgi:hypothetical protein